MNKGSKEFQELREQFERDIKAAPGYYPGDLSREPKDAPSGVYYCNGEVNKLFNFYLLGYQYAKALARMEALELNE